MFRLLKLISNCNMKDVVTRFFASAFFVKTLLTSLISARIFSLLYAPRPMAKNSYSDHNPYLGQPLTEREKEILRLMAADHTTSDIIDRIFVSRSTYEKIVAILKKKLNVRHLVAAYRAACDRKWK